VRDVTHAQLVEFLRAIHARPRGTGAILNLARGAKARGASDLGVLSDVAADSSLRLELARHSLDESRHAYWLVRRMLEIGFTPVRLPSEVDRVEGLFARARARNVHEVFHEHGWLGEIELLELLTAVLIPEEDAVVKLAANYEALAGDARTQSLVGRMLRDDRRHVAYLRGRLNLYAERFSPRVIARAEERLRGVFEELSVAYYAALDGYLERVARVEVARVENVELKEA
jgi:hypothetical protein